MILSEVLFLLPSPTNSLRETKRWKSLSSEYVVVQFTCVPKYDTCMNVYEGLRLYEITMFLHLTLSKNGILFHSYSIMLRDSFFCIQGNLINDLVKVCE